MYKNTNYQPLTNKSNNYKTEDYQMNTNKIKYTSQNFEYIKLNDCYPADYQRLTNDNQVNKIINNFDEAKLGVLTVSYRNGKYYIVDGLHRSVAMRKLGYSHALCIVLTGLTYEQEADYFRKQNQNKRLIITFEDFHAGLEANDPVCVNIHRIVKANKFDIGRGKSFWKIAAVKALFTIVEEYDYTTLDQTLWLIAHTWYNIPKASQSESLLGVAEFVHRYGTVEFAERMGDKFIVADYEYNEAMRVHASISSAASRRKYCQILVNQYNQGIRSNSKRYLKWEDK